MITKETTTVKEKIEIMQAFQDKKKIQQRFRAESVCSWEDCTDPIWNWDWYEYRIAPDELQWQYRPFKNIEELVYFWKTNWGYFPLNESRPEKPIIWVKLKHTKHETAITEFCPSNNTIPSERVFIQAGGYITLEDLFNKWTFLDDTPCGISENDKENTPLKTIKFTSCKDCHNYDKWEMKEGYKERRDCLNCRYYLMQ